MSKWFRVGENHLNVFDEANVQLPTNRRVAILGPERSGKSVLIRMLAGLEGPSKGAVNRYAALGFPVGYARALKPHLTGRQNTEHVARLYGADPGELCRFVANVTGFGPLYDQPVRGLPTSDRATLAYAIAYATPFDTYLIDENVAVGSTAFRAKCASMLEARAKDSGFILATRYARKARDLCDCGAVLVGNKIVWFDDVRSAISAFQAELARLAMLGDPDSTDGSTFPFAL